MNTRLSAGVSGRKIMKDRADLGLSSPLQNSPTGRGKRLVDMDEAEMEWYFLGLLGFVLGDDGEVSG